MSEGPTLGSGFPHADTTIEELERIAGYEPGNDARRRYFAACLKNRGSLTVQLTKQGDGPRLLRRYAEVSDEDRVRVLRCLMACIPDVSLDDIAARIYIA